MKFSIKSAKELYDAVSKCQKICPKESTRPVLEKIELVAKEDILTITALDGYRAIQKRLPINCEEPGTCVVDPQLLLDATGKEKAPVYLRTENESLICTRTGATSTVQLYNDSYIQHEEFWTIPEETYDIYFNLDYLADITKILKESNDYTMVHIRCNANNNTAPMFLSLSSGSRAMVLPVRNVD